MKNRSINYNSYFLNYQVVPQMCLCAESASADEEGAFENYLGIIVWVMPIASPSTL